MVQLCQRYNMILMVSHLRTIKTSQEKMRKNPPPRYVQPSTIGFICPVETPEGLVCGLLKTLSLGTWVSLDPSAQAVADYTEQVKQALGLGDDTGNRNDGDSSVVFFNGVVIGYLTKMTTSEAYDVLVKDHRHSGITGPMHGNECYHLSCIKGVENCLHIFTDGGRPLRLLHAIDPATCPLALTRCPSDAFDNHKRILTKYDAGDGHEHRHETEQTIQRGRV